MPSRWSQAVLVLVITGVGGANAFVAPSHPTAKFADVSSTTARFSESDPLRGMFGEQSRPYRRTVYTHDDWVKHRSSDRFVKNLSSLTSSGIYKSLAKEVVATTAVAAFVVFWNCLVGGYTDLSGVTHGPIIPPNDATPILGLPLTPFTLVSPSLGLLLVFRTNSSYGRWDEARKFWGLNINHTRDLNRMATAWYGDMGDGKLRVIDEEKRAEDLKAVSLCTWAFVRSMKRHLSPEKEDESAFKAEIYERLPAEQASILVAAPHRPNRALYDLSMAVDALPLHFMRKNQINTALGIFEDTLGGSERLLSSPVPLFYSRHTARFLSVWLLLLPFALWEPFQGSWNHVAEIPAVALISVCLFGIEELATQLEEPFTILPMQGFCDKIGANCDEIVSWAGAGQEKMTAPKGDMQEDDINDDVDEDVIATNIGELEGNVVSDDVDQEGLVATNEDEQPNDVISSSSDSSANIDVQEDVAVTKFDELEDTTKSRSQEVEYTLLGEQKEEIVPTEGDGQLEPISSEGDGQEGLIVLEDDVANDDDAQVDSKQTDDLWSFFGKQQEVLIGNDVKEQEDLIAAKDVSPPKDVITDVQQKEELVITNADEEQDEISPTTFVEQEDELITAGGNGNEEESIYREMSSVEIQQSSSTNLDSPDLELMRIKLEVDEIRGDLKLTNEALLKTEIALAELQSEVAVMRTQKNVQEDLTIANSVIEEEVISSVASVQEDVLTTNSEIQEGLVATVDDAPQVGDVQEDRVVLNSDTNSDVNEDVIATNGDVLEDAVVANGDFQEDAVVANSGGQEDVIITNGDVQEEGIAADGDVQEDLIAANGDVQEDVVVANSNVREDVITTNGDKREDVIPATNGDGQEDVIVTNGDVQEGVTPATNGDVQEDVIATNGDVQEDVIASNGVALEEMIAAIGDVQEDVIVANGDGQEDLIGAANNVASPAVDQSQTYFLSPQSR